MILYFFLKKPIGDIDQDCVKENWYLNNISSSKTKHIVSFQVLGVSLVSFISALWFFTVDAPHIFWLNSSLSILLLL